MDGPNLGRVWSVAAEALNARWPTKPALLTYSHPSTVLNDKRRVSDEQEEVKQQQRRKACLCGAQGHRASGG